MAIDNGLIIKKLQKLDVFFAAFSQFTKMPYAECDPETFDDQVYLFAEEETAEEWVTRPPLFKICPASSITFLSIPS